MLRALRVFPASGLIVFLLLMTGCGHHTSMTSAFTPEPPRTDRSVLAGEWQYEDGAVVSLRLDEQGNGIYQWKDGRFETTHLDNHTWIGKWYQQENDREGGFMVKLSDDYMEGEGTWWYIRIGDDPAPVQRGGTFRLTKNTSLTNLSETPVAP